MTTQASFYVAGIHYQLEFVRCGKSNCCRCPHGPYWYAYNRRGAFLRKSYVGKWLPCNLRDLVPEGLIDHCLSE